MGLDSFVRVGGLRVVSRLVGGVPEGDKDWTG